MSTSSKYYKPVAEITCPICHKSYKQGNYEKHIRSKQHRFAMDIIRRFIDGGLTPSSVDTKPSSTSKTTFQTVVLHDDDFHNLRHSSICTNK